MSHLVIVGTFVLAGNLVLGRMLGLCPFVGASRSREAAVAVGSATLFTGAVAGLATWAAWRLVLLPLRLGWLEAVAFMLLVAAAARLMEWLVRAVSPALHAVLAPHVEHAMTNSAILGVSFAAAGAEWGPMEAVVAGLAAAGGFALAVAVMAGIQGRLELAWVPRPLRGAPIALISAALVALAFLAFDGIVPAAGG